MLIKHAKYHKFYTGLWIKWSNLDLFEIDATLTLEECSEIWKKVEKTSHAQEFCYDFLLECVEEIKNKGDTDEH